MKSFVRHGGVFLGSRPDGRWRVGIWPGGVSVVLDSGMWCFRPPWNRPLFSERNGYHRTIFRRWGWRLFVKRPS